MSGIASHPDFPQSDRPHISPSQMDMYLRCGEQYRRRYILGEKLPPGIALVKGTAVHKAAETNYRQKLDTREDLTEKALMEAAAAGFEEAVRGGVFLDAEESANPTKALGAAKDGAVQLTRVFRREVAPRVQPALVEQFVRIPLPQHSHDLLGRMDLADAATVVRDLKTSSRRKTQEDLNRSDQMTFYALAYRHLTGERPAGVAMDVLVETKVPGSQILTGARDARDVQVFLHRVNAVLAGVKAGSFPPAPLGAWCCSPRFCGFWSSCPYVNPDRVAAAESRNGGSQ